MSDKTTVGGAYNIQKSNYPNAINSKAVCGGKLVMQHPRIRMGGAHSIFVTRMGGAYSIFMTTMGGT